MWSRMIILHLGYNIRELIDTSNDQYSLRLKKKDDQKLLNKHIRIFSNKKKTWQLFSQFNQMETSLVHPVQCISFCSLATSKGALESLMFNDEFVGQHDDLASTSQTGGARETSFCFICLMKIQHPAVLQQKCDICCSWDEKLLSSHWHI